MFAWTVAALAPRTKAAAESMSVSGKVGLSVRLRVSMTTASTSVIGIIAAEQTETHEGETKTVRNDRLVARLAKSRAFGNIEEVEQLGEGFTDELARFFTTYNALKDKKFNVLSIRGSKAASEAIDRASRR